MSASNSENNSNFYLLTCDGIVTGIDAEFNMISVETENFEGNAAEAYEGSQTEFVFYLDPSSNALDDYYSRWFFEKVEIGDTVILYFDSHGSIAEPIHAANIYIEGYEHMAGQ